jgi:hypothetical protein
VFLCLMNQPRPDPEPELCHGKHRKHGCSPMTAIIDQDTPVLPGILAPKGVARELGRGLGAQRRDARIFEEIGIFPSVCIRFRLLELEHQARQIAFPFFGEAIV